MNRVKDLHDAFIKYPPEEEWHQGNIEFVVNEETIWDDVSYKIGTVDSEKIEEYKNSFYNN